MSMPNPSDRLSIHLDAAEIMQHGVMFLDREANVLFVNRHFAQGLGYGKGDFQPKTFFQVNPHFNLMAWKKLWEELLEVGQVTVETEHITADGDTVPAKLRGVLLEVEGEKYCQAIVEGNLTESQEDLYLARFCLDNVNEMITWVSPEGRIFYANKAVREVLGYTAEELDGMKLADMEPGLTEDAWRKEWETVKQEGYLTREASRRSKNGDEFPVELSLHYMNYNGKEYKMAFVRDIRKRKALEEDIQLSFATIKTAPNMVIWLTEEANFRFFNDTFVQMTGYSVEDIEQMTILDFFPDFDLKKFKRRWEDLRTGRSVPIELNMVCKNGEQILVESNAQLINLKGKEFVSNILRDITKQRAQELELKQQVKEIEALQIKLAKENILLKEEIQVEQGFTNIISRSPSYKPILRQIGQVAGTSATVLILGETGTGKELLAKAIHSLSTRSEQTMVKINCGALPENLIESELFGHEKGAFTGAFNRKAGRFELAHRGTIFLDEIGELPLDLQAKLLRVLQEGEFERLGGTETTKVDVRVIAATNRNLEEMVEKGKFREDLFYRLNVFPIVNIPLRDRKEDIKPLVRHFIDKYNQKLGRNIEEIPESVVNELEAYEFPGNVRELENLIERAVILSLGKKLVANFQFKTAKSGKKIAFKTMEDLQRDHILEALRRTKGKVTGPGGAAEILGMNDKTLYSRMTKYEIGRLDYDG
ncbi:MAG: PAS domain S-box protein [Bacteroidetes bacterium]|nr:PAS domain S-box protein [Bacteroidota bacterium]